MQKKLCAAILLNVLVHCASQLCTHRPHLCVKGFLLAERVLKHRPPPRPPRTNNTVYVRMPPKGLPDWLYFLFMYRSDECNGHCHMIQFYDDTVAADATIGIQNIVRRHAHEVSIFVNLEAHSHDQILDCLDSGDQTCWHASFFMTSRVRLTYSKLMYGWLHVLSLVKSAERMEWCNAQAVFSAWFCMFNALAAGRKRDIRDQIHSIGVTFVSNNCDRHDGYLRELQSHVGIDHMGECHRNKNEMDYNFSRDFDDPFRGEFLKTINGTLQNVNVRKIVISSNYKFYISIENTILYDYITEKFWAGFLADTVMVYLGAPNAEMYAPSPRSYINALDFNSAQDLASYLVHLAATPDHYSEYTTWKRNASAFRLNPLFLEHLDDKPTLCDVCDQLNAHRRI